MVLFLTIVAIIVTGLIIANHFRSRAKRPRMLLMAVAAVVVVGIAVGASFIVKSLNSSVPKGWTWQMVSWRGRLFALKAEGNIPQFSWPELWFMLHSHGGFGLE